MGAQSSWGDAVQVGKMQEVWDAGGLQLGREGAVQWWNLADRHHLSCLENYPDLHAANGAHMPHRWPC